MCTLVHKDGRTATLPIMVRADGATVRPRDSAKTRERILLEARREFAARGYTATTVRAIATAAGVSPNLITRYFGGKEGLFLAATDVQLRLHTVFEGPRESLGERLANSIVDRWVGIDGEDPLLILLKAAGERPEAAESLSAFLDRESLVPATELFLVYGMSNEEATSRASALDVFVLGVSTRMRVLRDDLGDRHHLRSWLASTIQRIVDAP